MRQYGSGVVVAPCGSGKTILGLALIALRRQPALIFVHTKDLLRQTCAAARQWLGVEPGVIGEGKHSLAPITVGMVQTLHAHPEILNGAKGRFGLVMLDEAHHAPATTFTAVMQAFPAAYRYGLTATPERRDGLFPFLEAVVGPVRHEITNEDLRRAGVLVVPKIEYVRTDFHCSSSEWVDIIEALTEDAARNALALGVIERALDEGRQVLALTERVAHAQRLAALMESRRRGITALAVGTMKKQAREEAIERMRSGAGALCYEAGGRGAEHSGAQRAGSADALQRRGKNDAEGGENSSCRTGQASTCGLRFGGCPNGAPAQSGKNAVLRVLPEARAGCEAPGVAGEQAPGVGRKASLANDKKKLFSVRSEPVIVSPDSDVASLPGTPNLQGEPQRWNASQENSFEQNISPDGRNIKMTKENCEERGPASLSGRKITVWPRGERPLFMLCLHSGERGRLKRIKGRHFLSKILPRLPWAGGLGEK
jgi:hypothetical protein